MINTPTAPAPPPLAKADQRHLNGLLEQLRAGLTHPDVDTDQADAVAVFERLVAAMPTLRQRLPDDQKKLLGELDQTEEALSGATQQLHALLDHFAEWRDAPLDTIEDLGLFEEAITQLAQQATEAALRTSQRREVLKKVEG